MNNTMKMAWAVSVGGITNDGLTTNVYILYDVFENEEQIKKYAVNLFIEQLGHVLKIFDTNDGRYVYMIHACVAPIDWAKAEVPRPEALEGFAARMADIEKRNEFVRIENV